MGGGGQGTRPCAMQGRKLVIARVLLAQKFRGGNMGEVEVMGRLGGPRGWVQEGDVPPSAQSAVS